LQSEHDAEPELEEKEEEIRIVVEEEEHFAVARALFLNEERFRNTKSDPKFCRTGVVLVIPMPGKEMFRDAVPI
jgi:hypothetical protein